MRTLPTRCRRSGADAGVFVTMTTKHGPITNSFKVVKKTRRGGKQNKSPTPPPAPPPPEKGDDVFKTTREEELQKLRQFDLDWRFGPCTGISRLQRWDRAQLHGLEPPEEIRYLLLQTHTDAEYRLSLWRDYPF
ncbi:DNA polymerase delta subunit 4 isoform X2 [Nothobranchius furzeri]|uniref:DNA polymerase delta subunit 4 isoform X2 n=1 Tax=Nothobranchius furzeri TaxID=105023 RepID=UPI00390492F4